MHRIRNLTNSPYYIYGANDTKEIIPARGEIEIELTPEFQRLYRMLGYFKVVEIAEPDPDTEMDERAVLITKLEGAGIEFDGRWGVKRLREALESNLGSKES